MQETMVLERNVFVKERPTDRLVIPFQRPELDLFQKPS